MFAATSSSASARPPKRRIVAHELDFFTPAATSFKPRPYTPHGVSVPLAPPTASSALPALSRPLELHAMPPAGMDPQPTDPNVLFIHPPFTAFPNSALYPDGLSYHLMADNLEWFLDADDFMSQHNPNPSAIPYPPHLEPPRGWCPAKKKDLRDRGAEGWPEGEEPRLRCTFCRRTYAGVNAKKENRQLSSKNQLVSHDSLVHLEVAPQTEFRTASHKSKFRSLLPVAEDPKRTRSSKDGEQPPSPKTSQGESSSQGSHHPLSRSHVPPSPPLTPQSSDPANVSLESDSIVATSSPPQLPTVPPSPYDPLLTPSFRHSPPRLPSDQPWRFPSPSHPLHSRSRELSLSMLIRDLNSPVSKSSPAVGASPSLLVPSPRPNGYSKRVFFDLGTPESLEKIPRPSPRALFSRGGLGLPLPSGKVRFRVQESPLQRNSKTIVQRHKQSDSSISDEWLSEASTSNLDSSELLPGGDPFAIMYPSWGPVNSAAHSDDPAQPTITSIGTESPVLRNAKRPTGVGLGIGLLEPFIPEGKAPPVVNDIVDDSDFDGILSEEEGDEAEVADFLAATKEGESSEKTPPLKKRRVSVEAEQK
ncbi:hypothetical protein DXG03_007109 [Asterophora parasitica]|uniref:Uncharacterized protein n=1 Tax=Asterophora parasitica TaxID=117018 RepID=A0A9P7KG00_9AGAR|nr:hypothetical protein DXG03_007109 [Asterophora parasitica]